MNRLDKLFKASSGSFKTLLEKMDAVDGKEISDAIYTGDEDKVVEIAGKYGYMFIKPIELSMDPDVSHAMVESLLKNGTEKLDMIDGLLDDYTINHYKETPRFSKIPLDDISNVLLEARRLDESFYSDDKEYINKILNAFTGEDLQVITKAAILLDAIGCMETRNRLLSMYMSMSRTASRFEMMKSYNEKRTISDDRSKAKKGKTNRHQDEALKIVSDTLSKYPNASRGGLAEEVYAHLRSKWNDVPVAGTIERWIKDAGMENDVKPKNRNFKLVIG